MGNAAEQLSPKKKSYDVRLINAYIASVSEVFSHYLEIAPKLSSPVIKAGRRPSARLTGMIMFEGKGFKGSLASSFNDDFLAAIGKKMLGNFGKSDDALKDLTGELCNQILGSVRRKFADLGVNVNMSVPRIIVGTNRDLVHATQNPVLSLTLLHDGRKAIVEFCMSDFDLSTKEQGSGAHLEAGAALEFD